MLKRIDEIIREKMPEIASHVIIEDLIYRGKECMKWD